jgi:glycosyltransferase involved in cell wall biosynthesis
LPVWNGERYLAAAIDSVLDQSFDQFELLIVDDGSTDASPALIRRYRDARIRLFENEKNLGVTRSLNLGLGQARGRYVARMDADDLSAPDRLERQVVPRTHPRSRWSRPCARIARGVGCGVLATPTDGRVRAPAAPATRSSTAR